MPQPTTPIFMTLVLDSARRYQRLNSKLFARTSGDDAMRGAWRLRASDPS